MALTDHDTVAGLVEAKIAAETLGMRLFPAIELSTQWQKKCFHVVGLNINADYPPLASALAELQSVRMQRAEKIAEKLAKKNIAGAFDAVIDAAKGGMVTRSHFANFLVANHHVDSAQVAFDRYLAKGKVAYVATPWAELALAVQWIVESGGIAILAHPLRYKLTANAARRLLTVFKDAGGQGIEVVTSRITQDEINRVAAIAKRFALLGSVGSDFHGPEPWIELGRLLPLPDSVRPVWENLRLANGQVACH
jgi:predicted metal-dependent phosphoesterase TrpH